MKRSKPRTASRLSWWQSAMARSHRKYTNYGCRCLCRPHRGQHSVSTDESAPNLGAVGPPDAIFPECHLLKRAISRRACHARLWREEHIDTPREQVTDSQHKEPLPAED